MTSEFLAFKRIGGSEAGSGAENWGKPEHAKALSDFLFYNNLDNDSGKTKHNQSGQDYAPTGEFRWRGPYVEAPEILDP